MQATDPQFAYRVSHFCRRSENRASKADLAVEFVKANSEEAVEISKVLLKEIDKNRHTAGQVCETMKKEGFPRFNMQNHTMLWKELDAKNPVKGFGRAGLQEHMGFVKTSGYPCSGSLPRTRGSLSVMQIQDMSLCSSLQAEFDGPARYRGGRHPGAGSSVACFPRALHRCRPSECGASTPAPLRSYAQAAFLTAGFCFIALR